MNHLVLNLKFIYYKIVKREFNLNEATSQIISKTFEAKNFKLDNFTYSNPAIFFLKENIQNSYHEALHDINALFKSNLNLRLDTAFKYFLFFLIFSISTLLVAIIISIPFYNYVSFSQRQIVKIFLEIPLEKVKFLCSQSEKFLTEMQVNYFLNNQK